MASKKQKGGKAGSSKDVQPKKIEEKVITKRGRGRAPKIKEKTPVEVNHEIESRSSLSESELEEEGSDNNEVDLSEAEEETESDEPSGNSTEVPPILEKRSKAYKNANLTFSCTKVNRFIRDRTDVSLSRGKIVFFHN